MKRLALAFAVLLTAAPDLRALSQTKNPASASGANWITPANILDGSNNTYAIYANTLQDYLYVTNFGFSIPSDATILGIVITREGNAITASAPQRQYRMGLTKNGSGLCGTAKTALDLPQTTDDVVNVGAVSDLWGCSLSAAEVNSAGFGLGIADDNAVSNAINFDSVTVTVHYAPPAPADVQISSVFLSSITMTWTPVASEAGYLVQASTANDFTGTLSSSSTILGSLSSLTVLSPALVANTTYYIRVGSLWNDNTTSYAPVVPSTATLAAVPGAGSPFFTNVTLSSVTFHWTDGGNSSNTDYLPEISTDNFTTVNFSSGTRNLFIVFGSGGAGSPLAASTPYYFRVKALNRNNLYSGFAAVQSTTTRANAPVISGAVTVDDDLDGKIDAYHIFFSTPVDDSTLNIAGFQVQGYAGLAFASAGTAHYPDTADDSDIYITFSEGAFPDTGATPELVYNRSAGGIKSLFGDAYLMDVAAGDLAETDGASPVIVAASASDDSNGGPGIQTGDKVRLEFSEFVSGPPVLAAADIDEVLKTTVTWKDVSGNIGSAQWSAMNLVLTVTLSTTGGVPTLLETYTIESDSFTFKDAAGNSSSSTIVLGGGFGSDFSPPVIQSRETADLDHDGYIDAARIVFSENIQDSSVAAGDFDVDGVGGESFSSGDITDDNVIYIKFTDGILNTGATPNLRYTKGSLTDLAGNAMYSVPYTPCADKAPPAILSAAAGDGAILAPGLDGDDTVTITFSENTNRPTIDASNISQAFLLDNAHVWQDAYGTWNAPGNILTINFGAQAAAATAAVGDLLTVSSDVVVITDGALGNICTDTQTITGSFTGVDTASPTVVSVLPADGAGGIAVNTVIRVNFSERMSAANTQNAVTLEAMKNKNKVDHTVSGSVSYDAGVAQFVFTPASPLERHGYYRVNVSTHAADTIGNHLQAGFSSDFTTIAGNNESNTIIAVDDKTTVEISAGAFAVDFSIASSTSPLDNPIRVDADKIRQADSALRRNKEDYRLAIPGSIREFVASDTAGNPIETNFSVPVRLSIPYLDQDNDGLVDGIYPLIRETGLSLVYLREDQGVWVVIPSEVDAQNDTVSGYIPHFSVYAILGSNLGGAARTFAYPVPFMPNSDPAHTKITFTGLPGRATIKIYTVSGRLVKTLEESDGDYVYDWYPVKNEDGTDVASGVYIYRIYNDHETITGKLIIIR